MNRTHHNGQLRMKHVDQNVNLIGWVAKKRNLGSLVFVDLRDRFGITQIVFDESFDEQLKEVKNEYILAVQGKVVERSAKNPNLPTGDIEVQAKDFQIINKAKLTPMIIADETDALEETRMQYRYLDLRRPIMQKNLMTRHKITKSIREYLDDLDFIDIETPYLNRSTPEGARDFLVPSRVHKGSFYALPQSPQLFKQLLMVAGLERYYQIARCFRDEDLRADRQIEFTQVDVEMSFMSTDQVLQIGEGLIAKVMKDVKGIDVPLPLRRLTWHEAMERYGIDKPDTRFGLELVNLNEVVSDVDFAVFKDVLKQGGHVKGINVEGQAQTFSRKKIDKLTDLAKTYKAKGLAWLKVNADGVQGPIAKFFNEEQMKRLLEAMNAKENDLLLFVSDVKYEIVCDALAAIRNHLGKELKLYDPHTFDFLWVVDFPMFEYDDETQRYYAKHHPFTRPKESDLDKIENDPAHCLADAYDIVLNGFELGGGSQRIYEEELQERAFKALSFTQEQIDAQFGWFVEAFQYGTPPHAGFALGLDRLAMLLCECDSLRDVIAFPKNTSATCPMSKAPTTVAQAQLDELGIGVKEYESKSE
jgi:aspartyl-tRNA synthetase